MVNVKVAEDTPAAKNSGVMAKMASNMYPSFVPRFWPLVFLSRGPLKITVAPAMFDSDD